MVHISTLVCILNNQWDSTLFRSQEQGELLNIIWLYVLRHWTEKNGGLVQHDPHEI